LQQRLNVLSQPGDLGLQRTHVHTTNPSFGIEQHKPLRMKKSIDGRVIEVDEVRIAGKGVKCCTVSVDLPVSIFQLSGSARFSATGTSTNVSVIGAGGTIPESNGTLDLLPRTCEVLSGIQLRGNQHPRPCGRSIVRAGGASVMASHSLSF
jgi:hypothetical protein